MMRASASTQVSIDYKSEEDLTRKLRLLEIISPVFMIMMENKTEENSALPGASDKPHLLRIQEWEDLDPARTGFYPGSFDEDFGYANGPEKAPSYRDVCRSSGHAETVKIILANKKR